MGTKINKNCLKVRRLLMDFKSVPQREKLITMILGKISEMRHKIEVNTFFFGDHLILGTKINKNGLKVPRLLMDFKNVPQMEKG